VAAGPLAKLAFAEGSQPEQLPSHAGRGHAALGHASMVGAEVPAPGGPNDLDRLLEPPAALSHQPGRVREYKLVAYDREIEIAKGVYFPAWTYNGTVPGPVIRATEDDLLRVEFVNGSTHPHTIHFHGIHPANMDGVFEVVVPGASFTYEFPARPYGMHLYHCHSTPLKKHIHKGLYGAFIIDPPKPRNPAQLAEQQARIRRFLVVDDERYVGDVEAAIVVGQAGRRGQVNLDTGFVDRRSSRGSDYLGSRVQALDGQLPSLPPSPPYQCQGDIGTTGADVENGHRVGSR